MQPAMSCDDPGLTVVISTMDRPHLLRRCLTALASGTRRPAAVVVVDQGRHTDAGDVVAAARAQGLSVVHVRQERRGLSLSQNTGVRTARTPVVAVVDDDCVPSPDWIDVIVTAFAGCAGALLLTGRVLPLPPDGDRVAAVSTRASTVRSEWRRPPAPWDIGTGGNFAVTRDAFVAVGGNDERLGTGSPGRGANDLDLFHRLVASGVRARYEPELLVRHERSTQAEYDSRRSTYGFGVGVMLGLWLRRGDVAALRVLLQWLRLRARTAYQRRGSASVSAEVRVLAGTVSGLSHGLVGARGGPDGA